MTTIILIILALWLVPGIIAFVIAAAASHDWTIDSRDRILLVPLVNMVMLALVVIITIEDWILKE